MSNIFAATWNVGGKSLSSNMNLDDWLHVAPPADIYVLGMSSFYFFMYKRSVVYLIGLLVYQALYVMATKLTN